MNYGVVLPCMDARAFAHCANEAEQAGWDGVFVWDGNWGYNVWILLAAAAMRTERVRLGPMLTPPSRRRPWELASETATLDRLANGRLILSVGLGAAQDAHFDKVGEAMDRKVRAALLDESLDILIGLWSGQPFTYQGKYYQIDAVQQQDPPVQQPRIPIWVVGAWPRLKSMRRVLRCDGLLPAKLSATGIHQDYTPADIRAMKAFLEANRTAPTSFDIVHEGVTPGQGSPALAVEIQAWADAGVTWWLEGVWQVKGMDSMVTRIKQGPPRI